MSHVHTVVTAWQLPNGDFTYDCPKCQKRDVENEQLREALREIAQSHAGCCRPLYPGTPACAHNIARTALEEKP